MSKVKILWADDEIDLLKPQIMFLEQKGYEVSPVSNGYDAIEHCKEGQPDVVFLDESMPGLSGLETLTQIKELNTNLPIVMITKNEAENIMEEAIGAQITDYLIKPVNPNQILLTLKKIIDNSRLVSEKTTSGYQQEFAKIFSAIQMNPSYDEWVEIYKKIIYWELELDNAKTKEMQEVLTMQKNEANTEFSKFVIKNYMKWMQGDGPVLSHNLFKDKLVPLFESDKTNFLLVIDNLRFDQWKIIQPHLSEHFRFESEDTYCGILPTSTQYSRNAIFAGLTPLEISERYPDKWLNDHEEGGKNMHEEFLLNEQLKRLGYDLKTSYTKVTNHYHGKQLVENVHNLLNNDLNVIVYNFVDMLSHARTEMEVLKELASDETAYRSLTRSWFEHSPLLDALKKVADRGINIVITTDHGTIRVQNPSKVIGDKNTTTNLRYKMGKNLNFEGKDVLSIRDPHKAGLPSPNVSSSYIFAKEDKFFVYPNNYNHYVNYYKNTFQHGGISLEEMIIPVVKYTSK